MLGAATWRSAASVQKVIKGMYSYVCVYTVSRSP